MVGYGSFAIYGPSSQPAEHSDRYHDTISEEGKKTLLKIARESINAELQGLQYEPMCTDPELTIERGVFVTLKNQGELRGCLGRFEASGIPLYKLIAIISRETATHDMRFSPVTVEELPAIDIQISVLSPVKQILNIEEIQIGKHGLKIRGRNSFGMIRSGTLLPQVAVENQWDVYQFLSATCRKTGLDLDAWNDAQTEIFVYETLAFGDSDFVTMTMQEA
ncbi:MAG: AmmeMemoRadiSam system protein A [bacterium]